MPTLAHLTVKKSDAVTNIVFSALAPSTPTSPAVYQAPALGSTVATAPEYRIGAKRNLDGTIARITMTGMYPYHIVDSTTGENLVKKRIMMKCEWVVPQDVPAAIMSEAASQFANLVAHGQSVDSVRQAWAPT